jgi:hypothetical protein
MITDTYIVSDYCLEEIIVMQLVKYSYRLMLELATSQPRTAPLRPRYLGIKQIIGLSGEKKKRTTGQEEKKDDNHRLRVAVCLFISSYSNNMYERHCSVLVLISISFLHSIIKRYKSCNYHTEQMNSQPQHSFMFNMTQTSSNHSSKTEDQQSPRTLSPSSNTD